MSNNKNIGCRCSLPDGSRNILLTVELVSSRLDAPDEGIPVSISPADELSPDFISIVINCGDHGATPPEKDPGSNAVSVAIKDERQRRALRSLFHHPVDEVRGGVKQGADDQRFTTDGVAVDRESGHSTSPLRSEADADTSDPSTQTVAENPGTSEGAHGAGAASVAPAPRYIAAGSSVVDRAGKRVLHTSAASDYLAMLFNSGAYLADGFAWEDAA